MKPRCPDCGGELFCVDSSGKWWRCYGNHGERGYDMSTDAGAQEIAAGYRAESRANAESMKARQ